MMNCYRHRNEFDLPVVPVPIASAAWQQGGVRFPLRIAFTPENQSPYVLLDSDQKLVARFPSCEAAALMMQCLTRSGSIQMTGEVISDPAAIANLPPHVYSPEVNQMRIALKVRADSDLEIPEIVSGMALMHKIMIGMGGDLIDTDNESCLYQIPIGVNAESTLRKTLELRVLPVFHQVPITLLNLSLMMLKSKEMHSFEDGTSA
jgi:hypothetical protein